MGVSSSYRQAWRFFEMASESSSNVDALVKGPIMCAFDNLNITKHRSHLRKDCRLEMWDMATRLVISADIDPEVTIPRRDITRRAQIDESSILPSPEDVRWAFVSAKHFLMRFITSRFPSLAGMKKYCPPLVPFKKPTVPIVTPLPIYWT
eukprot:m.190483 g.190483  ORF g.190483 m.190483 type:complete len:150 (+) comp39433_c1_seq11:741-1190(+)